MSGHSIIAPSSAERRFQCPQSTLLESMYPEDDESEEAREGVAAHWAASEQLAGRLVDVGQIAPNGVVLTQQMCEGADLYYDDVVKSLAPFGLTPAQGRIEQPVAIPRVHALSWGTPDFSILLQGTPMRLMLWDYKFGHRWVDAFENRQCVEYAAGLTEGLSDLDPGVEVTITIVQPRSFHRDGPVRRWRTTLAAMRALINQQSNAAHEALGPEPRATVGPECRDCRGRHACPQLQASALQAMDTARHIVPLELSPAAAGLELRLVREAQERLKARASGLEQQLESMIRKGGSVPFWRLAPGESRERWKVPAAQVIATAQMLHLDVAKPPDVITPAQARAKGLDPALVELLAERPPAGMQLVEDDGSAARRVFG